MEVVVGEMTGAVVNGGRVGGGRDGDAGLAARAVNGDAKVEGVAVRCVRDDLDRYNFGPEEVHGFIIVEVELSPLVDPVI